MSPIGLTIHLKSVTVVQVLVWKRGDSLDASFTQPPLSRQLRSTAANPQAANRKRSINLRPTLKET